VRRSWNASCRRNAYTSEPYYLVPEVPCVRNGAASDRWWKPEEPVSRRLPFEVVLQSGENAVVFRRGAHFWFTTSGYS